MKAYSAKPRTHKFFTQIEAMHKAQKVLKIKQHKSETT
jgi:hypothetical protein